MTSRIDLARDNIGNTTYQALLCDSAARPHYMELSRFGLVLFDDIWSQKGHSVSCMTTLFLKLQITKSDIRPHMKWAVSQVITYGQFNFSQGFMCVYMG